jgi:3-oxoacyl-[acyl-carrier-protein] synthase III
MAEAERAPIGLRGSVGIHGEIPISHEEIATLHEVPVSVVDKWIGSAQVYATARPIDELAVEASRKCLALAGVSGREVSAIVANDCNGRRIQGEIDAQSAVALEASGGCAAFVVMLARARSMLREDEAMKCVLVVCAFKLEGVPLRSIGRMSETVMRDIFSDGAGAVLVERGAGDITLLSTGYATTGLHWDYYERFDAGEPVSDIVVMQDSIVVFRTALERCLSGAKLSREDIASALFPFEGPLLPRSFARAMGLDLDRMYLPAGLPMHVGSADSMFALEHFLASRAGAPGDHVLMVSRGLGAMGVAALRLPGAAADTER